MKKIYLDVCTLCRPFDDQKAMRIRLETDAFYLIMSNVHNGLYELVISNVHFKEISAIENVRERLELLALLRTYGNTSHINKKIIRKRANELYQLKFGIGDAAHIAVAEQIADVFISCDDKLLKKCSKYKINIKAINPINFCIKEDLK